MTYEYVCPICKHRFDVVKPVKDFDLSEHCPECGDYAERQFVPRHIHFTGTAVQHAEYNPGLGQIVRNKYERAEICRAKGLIEIGNESPEKTRVHFEKAREEKREASWADTTAWVGDGSS